MKKNTYIFSYGTLQEEFVQKTIFKRKIDMIDAKLENFVIFADSTPYFGIIPSKDNEIYGKILEITEDELKLCDLWEDTPALYQREIYEVFANNLLYKVWIYNKKPNGEFKVIKTPTKTNSNLDKFIKDLQEFINKINK
ncbi:gamma-glutamylcyclotransferase family protein [Mycoplasma sp. Mirounga ES2805-ORL]|uniref:gamma-glutamylcyclotransferase family protein n=1 Tax=Mycoplasma sp. Mirounga ES2805-ORL TaxID=754514 RepID=UPI00197B37BE|nr:gamma-glutamylcyclotransferase family protein [Mycoplasma sp. Mirounga ES2805-ORL]QSF13917.1 gamma-glutamylcyclotransferase [Mycoplasma sp. Mirounga ES2805-ORL]